MFEDRAAGNDGFPKAVQVSSTAGSVAGAVRLAGSPIQRRGGSRYPCSIRSERRRGCSEPVIRCSTKHSSRRGVPRPQQRADAGVLPRRSRQYFRWIGSVGLPPLQATRAHIELYRAWMDERGLAPATVDRRLSTVCGYYRFAHIDGRITSNPAQYVRRPRVDPLASPEAFAALVIAQDPNAG